MAIREYVGARYVPIFGRKGEDSIEWDNSKPYEPLTIVLYQGNSFTSRQYVPAGIDIDNEQYWASTGVYNAQVEQYRQEVRLLDGRITQNADDIETLSGNLETFEGTTNGAIGNLEEDLGTFKETTNGAIGNLEGDLGTFKETTNGAIGNLEGDLGTFKETTNGAIGETNADLTELSDTVNANGWVTAPRIADGAVTHGKIGEGAVTSINIDDGAIGLTDMNVNVQQRMRAKSLRYSRVVFIGDSYGQGVGGNADQGWPYYTASYLGLSESQWMNVSNSGAGFIAQGRSEGLNGMTFQDQIDYAYNNLPASWGESDVSVGTSAQAVDLVVIGGGYNDHAQSGIPETVKATVTHAKTRFPNARIVCVPLCVGVRELNGEFWSAYHRILDGAMQAGAATTENGLYWLMPYAITASSGDNVHPNDTGYKIEGYNMASFIMGGNCEPYSTLLGASAEGFSVGSGTTNNGFRCGVSQGVAWASGNFSRKGTGHGVLCTLPSYLRPLSTVYLLAFAYADSAHHGVMRLRLTADGKLETLSLESGEWDNTLNWTIYLPYITIALGHTWQ